MNTGLVVATAAVQVALGLGLWNVWTRRRHRASPFRGAGTRSMRDEFAAYGIRGELPVMLVGALKIFLGGLLLLGPWVPHVTTPAAALLVVLMVGALGCHWKIRDPLVRSVPAALALVGALLLLAGGFTRETDAVAHAAHQTIDPLLVTAPVR